jgi:trimethylamine--corrinoid protein Co-methyltransferase
VDRKSEGNRQFIQPKLTLLDQEQVQRVHEYSLQILDTVGIRVDSERARQLLRRATDTGGADGNCVRIPRELIEWAVATAPPAVDIYDQQRTLAFCLPGEARFGIGVTALYYQDPETGRISPFARRNMEAMVRLGGALPSFDVVSTVGIVQDIPPERSDLYAVLEMTANTLKPLVVLVSDADAFGPVLDLLEHLHGDLAPKPFIIPYFNPISPLVINKGTVDKMWLATDRGLPFIYSNYGMAGATTPIAPAGALALLNAELLAGLTLSQLMREGTPVILGSLPAYFDMKGVGSFYAPRSYLASLACAEMMAHYGLPHCGTSGSGLGWGADVIAAGHQWMNHLLSCMGKGGLVPFVGDTLGSVAFSPAIAVYANDVIEQARIFARGFSLDDAAVRLGEIAQVGPGGDFLISPQTLELFRMAYFRSPVLPHLVLEEWQAQGCPQAGEVLGRYTSQLVAELEAPEDHAELLARGEAFIRGI